MNKATQSKNLLSKLKEKLMSLDNLNDMDKRTILNNILKMEKKEINLLITGATGSGKSSTINALFETDAATVGMSSLPETMDIKKYSLDNLVIWDSPGFGDGINEDIRHGKGIAKLLNEIDQEGHCKIDLVLVLLDGGSRDYGTTYKLLEKVIMPNIGHNDCRILVAINQADMVMNGKGWDHELNRPTEELIEQLDAKVKSTQIRIKENTSVDIKPIYYSAGYQDEFETQRPYNLAKLLHFIVENIPANKRFKIADNMTTDENLYATNDDIKDYTNETKKSMAESLMEVLSDVSNAAVDIVSDTVVKTFNTAVKVGSAIVSAGRSLLSGIADLFSR
ncbi:GTPase [uncultured Psychromonas sp.]|uniref:GTPase family protein n=1 Tax=uncultured Psychromonas sp. TaxID=173974 RepID=UPI00262519C1|nr:GTPase [uncultured Psychromonas sp.]